jgi:archaeal flagellin FlaB
MNTFLAKLRKAQEGITGLETAIVLIAFVIVASVFAYVVLSAGLFASQKTKEAVTSGLGSTMSVLELKGDVIARMSSGVLTEVILTVGIPSAGSPVDFGTANCTINGTTVLRRMVIVSYADDTNIIPSCTWSLGKLCDLTGDDLLDPNELFQIDVDLGASGNVSIPPYHRFSIEVKPPDGPVMSIERMIPGRLTSYINLH